MRSSLTKWNLLHETDGEKVQTQQSVQRLMDHQLRGVRAVRKTALCSFSWALSETINTSTDELDHFMKLPALDPDSNVLEWWKTNAERLPTLSRVAGQLLCIPGTPVPSERINSTSGNIVT